MESNAESAETCHRKVATSMLKVASDIYKTPLYRTAHSPENSSDEWAVCLLYIRFTFVVTQIASKSVVKTIIKPNRFTRIEKMPAHRGDSAPSVGGHIQ